MKYEIVELGQKIVVGKSIITSNSDPKMGEQIGRLWFELHDAKNDYYGKIKNKVSENAIGLYSDYVGDKYTVTAGAEVSEASNADFVAKTIVGGKYAKFAVHGNMVTSVAKAWGEIWATQLDRTFTGDFEEYLPCNACKHMDSGNFGACAACEDCDINIYVAIK